MGFLPLQLNYLTVLRNDFFLYGKLGFYEKGFIYTDTKLGAFVVPHTHLSKILFHMNDEQNWIEFQMNELGKNLIPAQLLAMPTFFIMMPAQYCRDRFNYYEKLFRNDPNPPQVLKVYDKLERLFESFTMVNFKANFAQYNAVYGSEYVNFYTWQQKNYKELCDFHVI